MINTTTKKPPLGIKPRHFWLDDRIQHLIETLENIFNHDEMNAYLDTITYISKELIWTIEQRNNWHQSNE